MNCIYLMNNNQQLLCTTWLWYTWDKEKWGDICDCSIRVFCCDYFHRVGVFVSLDECVKCTFAVTTAKPDTLIT